MNVNEWIKKMIKKERQEFGLTQRQYAKSLNVHLAEVQAAERGMLQQVKPISLLRMFFNMDLRKYKKLVPNKQ